MKQLPFSSKSEILGYCESLPTPFYLYDEEIIKSQCKLLQGAFFWHKEFQNYFAVKATPNPHVLRIIKEQGFGVDCSSYAELRLAESVGFKNDDIFFTSNNTGIMEYRKAVELGAIINLDDVSHIELLNDNKLLPEHLCLRYNPGPVCIGNHIIGNPIDSKFGMTKEQLLKGYKRAQSLGCKKFSLHTMIVSNSLDVNELLQNAEMMFELIKEIKEQLNISIQQVNLGGGIGISYKPNDKPFDIMALGKKIKIIYNEMLIQDAFHPLKISFECGRFVTGPSGVLVSQVINKKTTYKQYLGVDASVANIMRPAMYGAYHHITHISKDEKSNGCSISTSTKEKVNLVTATDEETPKENGIFDVVGSLCENNDKLATDRFIANEVVIGDILVIHDAGAHCSAMGFNYNGKLQCAEYLRMCSGELKLIRRAETYADLFATLSFKNYKEL